MQRALARGEVHAPAAVDEAWGDVGAVLADARQEPGFGGRIAGARHAQQIGRGHSRAGTEPRAPWPTRDVRRARRPSQSRTRSCWCPGSLGLVYLPQSAERLTLEQIAETHPRLLDSLTAHPGIGFVMVRSRAQGRS